MLRTKRCDNQQTTRAVVAYEYREAEFGGGGKLVNRALIALAAVLAALAVSIPGAFGRILGGTAPTATPGVTSSSITIGGTFPLSGPASLYAPIPRGMEAYFNWINTRKGPDGKI